MFLLDTNVVSELRRPKPHGAVVAWLRGVDDADLHLAAVSLGEIQAGVEITRERDPAKAAEVTSQLSPKVVIPMQFATASGDRSLANLENFCRNLGVSVPEPTEKLSLKASDLGETLQVVALAVS